MCDFFNGWRRKAGLVTLGLACVGNATTGPSDLNVQTPERRNLDARREVHFLTAWRVRYTSHMYLSLPFSLFGSRLWYLGRLPVSVGSTRRFWQSLSDVPSIVAIDHNPPALNLGGTSDISTTASLGQEWQSKCSCRIGGTPTTTELLMMVTSAATDTVQVGPTVRRWKDGKFMNRTR